jgi:hypothetical protein
MRIILYDILPLYKLPPYELLKFQEHEIPCKKAQIINLNSDNPVYIMSYTPPKKSKIWYFYYHDNENTSWKIQVNSAE